MTIEIHITGNAPENIRKLAQNAVPSARRQLVQDALAQTLQTTIELNPVDTGRSRAAWVSSLEELGGAPPADWEGPHPSATDEGRRLGHLSVADSADQSAASAVSAVSYVGYLEYGTRKMAPFAMVRRALLSVVPQLAALFHLSGPAGSDGSSSR
jgi:hypothetical protein